MDAVSRWNVRVEGPADGPVLLFAHGFGCDQTMWRQVAPRFTADHRVVLFDYIGFGGSDASQYDPVRYATLDGYAADVLALCHELGLRDVTFVGHSVSAMVGVLAQRAEPDLFRALVMVGPSARYLDDDGYVGGFTREEIDDLLELMESNHLGWQAPLASMVAGAPAGSEVGAELEAAFCRTRPDVARQLAEVTFLGDNRDDLAGVSVPALVLQSRHDGIAPLTAGTFVHEQLPDSRLVVVETHGHCPQLSAPDATTEAIKEFLAA